MKRRVGPSTRNLAALPEPSRLNALTRSLALLDTILCEDENHRYYSFDSEWARGEQVATMRNGQGDQWFLWFGKEGCALLGFDHESPMSPYAANGVEGALWPGLLEGFPRELGQVLKEPAFEPKVITFAIWRLTNEMKYKSGNVRFPKRTSGDPDGSEYLLSVLDGNPETYVKFASDYYESPIPIAPVRKIYGHEPLLAETVQELSKERSVVAVMRRARALGFKTSR